MATLTVGQGQQYKTIASAVAASHDGDVIQVQAGTYTNDFAEIKTKITLQGVGGMVNMVATEPLPSDKGILVTDTDVTIDHFSFSGATGPSGNDAGIRYQGGALVLTNDYFHDNQNGLLANPSTTGTISIANSEFAHNGSGDGFTHNLYVGDIAKLTITDSYFHDAVVGHEIKSRAEVTDISNTRVFDNSGSASYSIDLPNGGQATLTGNTIEQGPNSQNPNIVAYGEEGGLHANSTLTMTNNTVLNDLSKGSLLWDASGSKATVSGTSVWNLADSQMVSGSGATVTGTTHLGSEPALDTSDPWAATGSGGTGGGTGGGGTGSGGTTQTGSGTLNGGVGNDTLQGQGGNDILHGGPGSDHLDGGAGVNTALYDGVFRQYTVGAGGGTVSGGPEGGADTLVNIQRIQFVDGYLATSPTDTAGQVYRLYEATLDRAPDPVGLANWAHSLNTGASLESVANGFVASTEFQLDYGNLSNAAFVTLLYQNVLHRAPDTAGLNNWVSALNSGQSQAQVVLGFSESQEDIKDLSAPIQLGVWVQDTAAAEVARLYDTTFGRLPDVAGLTNWTQSLESGTSLQTVANGFVGSAEFQADYGNLNNTAFVNLLYQNVLHRAPDTAGLNNWVTALNGGMSRAQVTLGFSESAEHIAGTAAHIDHGIWVA